MENKIWLGVILAMALVLTLGVPGAEAVTYGGNVSEGYNIINITANNSMDVNTTYAATQNTSNVTCGNTVCGDVIFNTSFTLTFQNITNITSIQFALPDTEINLTDNDQYIMLFGNTSTNLIINATPGHFNNSDGYPVVNFTLNSTCCSNREFGVGVFNFSIIYRLPLANVTKGRGGNYTVDGAFAEENWTISNPCSRLNMTAMNVTLVPTPAMFANKVNVYNTSANDSTLTDSWNGTHVWAYLTLNSSWLVNVRYRMSTSDSGTGGASGGTPTAVVTVPTTTTASIIAIIASAVIAAVGCVGFLIWKKPWSR